MCMEFYKAWRANQELLDREGGEKTEPWLQGQVLVTDTITKYIAVIQRSRFL